MALKDFIQQSFDRHYDSMMQAVKDLTPEEYAWRPGAASNSIGFLVWHYGRALDMWIQTQARGTKQLWETEWAEKFNRPPDPADLGFGYTEAQLAAFELPAIEVVLAYAEAARANAMSFLAEWDDDALDRETIPHRRGGTITLAMLFQMLLWEVNQHGGQIAYLRGMQRGLGG